MSSNNERIINLLKQLEIGEKSKMIADFDRKEFLKNLKEKHERKL